MDPETAQFWLAPGIVSSGRRDRCVTSVSPTTGNARAVRRRPRSALQKALEQMNVKLTEVISDITGLTGMSIIEAILAGQRDPETLAKLRHEGCKNDEATIALALQGNWREEHLFALRQSLQLYRVYHEKLLELDAQIESYLQTFGNRSKAQAIHRPKKKPRRRRDELAFDSHGLLFRMTGVDLTTVDGIGSHSALQLISGNRHRHELLGN